MSEQMNAPMLPPPSGVSEWVSVWRDALTKPSDQTYARIAQSPNAKSTTAFLWIFLGSLVNFFLASLVQGAVMRQMMQNSDLGIEGIPAGAGGGLIAAICGAPIGAVISVVMFGIVVGIVQFIAKMLGGLGTFDQLTYSIAAIVTPFYLVSSVLTLLSAIPAVGWCFGILGLLAGLYVLALEVMAVKGVNQFGWGQALASLLLPVFAIACCLSIAVIGIMQAVAPQLMDIFNSITTPVP
jgi:hypothetical protein